MDVLVTGGDGFVGRNLCAELAERDHDVTSLSRSPDATVLPDDVDVATGDVTDYESIEAAFESREVVVNLVALSPLFEPDGGSSMHESVHLGGTQNCVKAAESQGVDRFVQMSALGADEEGKTHYIRAKGRAETVVRESDLDWTVFRPSVVFGPGGEFVSFTDRLTTPYVSALPGGGATRFQPIFVEDLVRLVADAIETDSMTHRTYEIGGPEVLTLAQVATLIHRSRGRSLTVVPIPMAMAGIGLTLAGKIPGFPMGRDQYRSLTFDNTVGHNDIDAFDLEADELTTLRTFLGQDGRN